MRIKSTLTTALLAATLINLDQWLHPDAAHAVFFQVAEVWLTGIFTTTGNAAAATGVSLTINIIRAILLIWIALGIVRTVQAARNDEDWQTAARVPIFVTISVVVGDIITTLIIPTAT